MPTLSTLQLAEAYVHQIDPFAIQFSNGFGIRWYGLSYAIGFLIGWLFFRWMAGTNRSPLSKLDAGDFIFAGIIGVLIGGRLGYVLFYKQHLAWTFTDHAPWWGLLAINDGGMASHGGMIGFVFACVYFGARRGFSKLHLLDLGSFAAGIGLSIGRLANFINAELKGRLLPDAMQDDPPAWSVKFPNDVYDFPAERLIELTPAVTEVGVDIGEWNTMIAQLGTPEANTAVQNVLENIVHATQHGNVAVVEALRPVLDAYYPSQLIQALTDGPIVVPILALIWMKPRKPGVIGAWLLTVYGALRIISEQFRQPDEGVGLILGLSRGQVLSVLMVIAGIISIVVTTRRPVEPMACLRHPMPELEAVKDPETT